MADEKITVLARIKARKGMEEELCRQAMCLIEPTRAEAGCINYDLCRGADDKSLFMFYENWISKNALDEHLQTPHLKAFIAKADGLLAEPLDVILWQKVS